MRLISLCYFLISFFIFESQSALAQPFQSSPKSAADAASNLTWKATLMTGDDSIDAFDNARKTLKSEFLQMGVTASNIKELSLDRHERRRGSLPSSAGNLAGAMRDLSVGDQDACLIHM